MFHAWNSCVSLSALACYAIYFGMAKTDQSAKRTPVQGSKPLAAREGMFRVIDPAFKPKRFTIAQVRAFAR